MVIKNAIVLHNKETNELSVLKTIPKLPRAQDYDFKFDSFKQLDLVGKRYNEGGYNSFNSIHECPNCGFILDQGNDLGRDQDVGNDHADGMGQGIHNMDGFIHSNYFKLLGNGIIPSQPFEMNNNHLSESLFTQGYFHNFFKEIELLGRGARGSVYKVEHVLNGISLGFFALKKITIGDDSKWLLKVLKEVTMLCKISFNNQNLVNYNHVWLEISSINEFGPQVPCAFILQQYCSGGNLEDFIVNLKNPKLNTQDFKKWKLKHKGQTTPKGRFLTNEEILIIFNQIVIGVNELHKNHIIHRDLKPSNCLLSKPYETSFNNPNEVDISKVPTIVVSDFGESQLEGEKRNATGSTGTLEYTAPEILNVKDGKVSQFNKKTDVYSLGMILYFLSFSKLPFMSQDIELLKNEIINHDVMKFEERDQELKVEIKELIKKLTSMDPDERLSTNEILNFLQGVNESIHNSETVLEKELIDDEEIETRRLSLTDGKAQPIDTYNILINNNFKIFINLINFGIVMKFITTKISPFLLVLIGISINLDIKYTYYLSLLIFITLILNYIL
ncbi:Calcium-dependent protein kinase 2 [Wickerhamomyces ciferrii]|uniref:non-specific serine/threonine protein kinase n=1 Tax=Wickerhamomyces ciferrii (strain ATCC 14091 / BCRC 22168 / CBS 111 / JCM 3599 / NBRC 0793 / NRRL Y-1031 F-60-10) TaxID=1206466 RepID=K0KQI3_WICCF|nr:Calcium-dependent protein kinase 2 [Wickerhamomyces ciferrii]CCH45296.1 Calcium-dependent protein kinase 2 [Wickerhamomyces ciferrii]